MKNILDVIERNGRLVPVLSEEKIEENLPIVLDIKNYTIKTISDNHTCHGVQENMRDKRNFRGCINVHARDSCLNNTVPKPFPILFANTQLELFGNTTRILELLSLFGIKTKK